MFNKMDKLVLKKFFRLTDSYRENFITEYTLSSGKTSPYYIDCKKLLSYPYIRKAIGEMGELILLNSSFDCVGGFGYDAISFSQIISDHTKVGMFYVKNNDHRNVVDGSFRSCYKALVVSDVFLTGDSILKAATAARQVGMSVSEALVIVNSSTGYEDLQLFKMKHGITVHSMITVKELGEE